MSGKSGASNGPVVSVIVPCFNSETTIRPCLNSLIQQKAEFAFDITVVDSGTDATASIVRKEFPSVRLIVPGERKFAGAARNIGVRSTAGRFVTMIDSDCVADSSLISRAVHVLSSSRYAAVGGAIRDGTPKSWSGLMTYLMEFKEFLPATPERAVLSVPTANVTYRREVFEHLGGFDESMWLAEDILFNWKLCKAGHQIWFDPGICVTHSNRTGWKSVFQYQYHMGRLSAKARKKGGLPGAWLLKYPVLIPLLPFGRTVRAASWLLRYELATFVRFLAVWPIYFTACAVWAAGFFAEAVHAFESGQ